MMIHDLGLSTKDIERLKSFSNETIRKELEIREKNDKFVAFAEGVLALYAAGQLRGFIEHREELLEEYNALLIKEHNISQNEDVYEPEIEHEYGAW